MASLAKVVDILDDVLAIDGTARRYAETLQTNGLLPRNQGRSTDLDLTGIAFILIAMLLGEPTAAAAPARSLIYAGARNGAGVNLRDALAKYLENPGDFFELSVDLRQPTAALVFRGADHGMATSIFRSEGYSEPAGIERIAKIDASVMTRLAVAIRNAPPAGRRRRRHEKFGVTHA